MAFLGDTLLNVGLLENDHFYPKWKADKCEWLSSNGQSWLLPVREMEGLRQLLKLQKVRSPRKLLKGEGLGPVSSAGTGPASWSGVLTDSPS